MLTAEEVRICKNGIRTYLLQLILISQVVMAHIFFFRLWDNWESISAFCHDVFAGELASRQRWRSTCLAELEASIFIIYATSAWRERCSTLPKTGK